MSKVEKYTCRLHRYNYTHDQLNTRHYDFLEIFLRGGGRKIQVCPRAPDTLATPLLIFKKNPAQRRVYERKLWGSNSPIVVRYFSEEMEKRTCLKPF